MTIWRGKHPLILASQSHARKMLLANAGISFEAVPADIDERVRAEKFRSFRARRNRWAYWRARRRASYRQIIPAVMSLAPTRRWRSETACSASPPAARRPRINCALLAGRTHELHSAVAVARDGKMLFSEVSIARMTMRQLSGEEIRTYLDAAGDAVTTSVGAYQLEGLGVHLFERIEGDHFTILGLPLLPSACIPAGAGATRCLKRCGGQRC